MSLELFKNWIEYKFRISLLARSHQIKEGEVYWCSLGVNVGDEENGKGFNFRRPVLVFKKFNNNIFLGIPLTTKNKVNKYYVQVIIKDVTQSAMISQIRVIDTKRIDDKIGYVSKNDFSKIKLSVINMIK